MSGNQSPSFQELFYSATGHQCRKTEKSVLSFQTVSAAVSRHMSAQLGSHLTTIVANVRRHNCHRRLVSRQISPQWRRETRQIGSLHSSAVVRSDAPRKQRNYNCDVGKTSTQLFSKIMSVKCDIDRASHPLNVLYLSLHYGY